MKGTDDFEVVVITMELWRDKRGDAKRREGSEVRDKITIR